MADEYLGNNAITTLNGAITAAATTLTPTSFATPFPQLGQFRIIIDSELLLVTSGAGTNTWTVTRGVEGTAWAP